MDTTNKEVKQVEYTEAEKAFRSSLIKRLVNARDIRESPHDEFDGMSYSMYYDSNRKADLAYNKPRNAKNKDEVSIVTGMTREKDNTLLSTLLGYSYDPFITAKDKDNLVITELGSDLADLVKDSRDNEEYWAKRHLVYRELISQGDVFVEEVWAQEKKDMPVNPKAWKPGQKIGAANSFKYNSKEFVEKPEIRLLRGKGVYLFNFYESDYSKQPGIATYDVISYEEAKAIYGDWDRFDCVPKQISSDQISEIATDDAHWNMGVIEDNKVGVLKVQLKYENRYMIMLNGVMMLPIDYPLTNISPTGDLTISMGHFEQIFGIAYSKGQPSKSKVDQSVLDEFLRLMLEKTKQSFKPPLGTSGKKQLSSDMFNAGKVSYGIREGTFFPILPQGTGLGVTAPEFSMFQTIKQDISEKTINATFSGTDEGSKKTATQIVQEKQQQLLKLGLAFDGVKNLEKQMVWRRIFNILAHYGDPIDYDVDEYEYEEEGNKKVLESLSNKFRTISTEGTTSNGEKATKIIRITDKMFPTEREQQAEERNLSKENGKTVQITYINPSAFSKWVRCAMVVNIVPSEGDTDILKQQTFSELVNEAYNLFGPEALNMEHLKQRFATIHGEDYNKFFAEQSIDQILKQKEELLPSQVENGGVKDQKYAGGLGQPVKISR